MQDGRLIVIWSSASQLFYPLAPPLRPTPQDGASPQQSTFFSGLRYDSWTRSHTSAHLFGRIKRSCGSIRRRDRCFRTHRGRLHFWLSIRLLANSPLWFCMLRSCKWTPRRRRWVRMTSHPTCRRSISISPIFNKRSSLLNCLQSRRQTRGSRPRRQVRTILQSRDSWRLRRTRWALRWVRGWANRA